MRRVIYKYPLVLKGEGCAATVTLPVRAQILSVGFQHGEIFLWARIDPTAKTCERLMYVVPTGCDVPERIGFFLGRAQDERAGLVFHIFEG